MLKSIKKYGVLVFNQDVDKKENIKLNQMSGIACIANQKPFAFKRIKELPANVIWFSNLDKYNVWRTGRFDNIKDKNFLGISYEALLFNYFLFKYEDKEDIAQAFASLFEKVMFGIESLMLELDQSNQIDKGEIVHTFYQLHQVHLEENTPKNIQGIFETSYMPKVKIDFDFVKETEHLSMLLSPTYYVNELFKTTIPVGNWTMLSLENLNLSTTKEILTFLKEKYAERVHLFQIDEVTLKNTFSSSPYNAGVLWLGTRGSLLNGKLMDAIWVTGEELAFMQDYFTFSIINVLLNDKSISGEQLYKKYLPATLSLSQNELKQTALVFQLILKTFANSFLYYFHLPKKIAYSETMFWLQARDRFICFNSLYALNDSGLRAYGYGGGEITLVAEKANYVDLDKLIQTFIQHKLIFPYRLIRQICNVPSIENLFLKEVESISSFNMIEHWHILDAYLKYKLYKQGKWEMINLVHFLNTLSFSFTDEDRQELQKQFALVNQFGFTESDINLPMIDWLLRSIRNIAKS